MLKLSRPDVKGWDDPASYWLALYSGIGVSETGTAAVMWLKAFNTTLLQTPPLMHS